ncbi:sigma-70 family RNA polymerase sigma factor [Actinopolymorpha singaporensis]|uniref:RNA polymerase sigma-70 factor, ECF subfamily n=1 Tax=Actinopolymorpha singaporensis TaxID=117157 RepID=A0A1H1M1U7_9ACTN|nr:sigma-70 family RNA polymerase sigma factor [Actinopolymorpha singaporensis]SDR80774.1 RNA polymerase sigma-70 factor, ECF subfamily [Actinopolymorpha singaporensis]
MTSPVVTNDQPAGDLAASDQQAELGDLLDRHRVELTGYCYRMLGSGFEAEDAVQETMLRAWRFHDRYDGRASLRSWLYRIATNVCLDALEGRKRRARPMDLGPAQTADNFALGEPLPDAAWVQPVVDGQVLPPSGDPAEVAVARESIRLAFVAALQHLPPRQRAVLILREVLRWRASEVAELLETSVASVNSALQRARATLEAIDVTSADPMRVDDEGQQKLLARYVDAFERYDMDALVALLHEDATLSMPPYALWVHGPAEIATWMSGPGIGCAGSLLVPVEVNGSPAFGQYRRDPAGGHVAFALQVIEVADGAVTAINAFLDTEKMFPFAGLPLRRD